MTSFFRAQKPLPSTRMDALLEAPAYKGQRSRDIMRYAWNVSPTVQLMFICGVSHRLPFFDTLREAKESGRRDDGHQTSVADKVGESHSH